MKIKTLVVLIFFNRPDTTKAVFETIRLAKPVQLFIKENHFWKQ
jgi:hypothetical protein